VVGSFPLRCPVALVAVALVIAAAATAQTTGGRFTIEEINTAGAIQAAAAVAAIPPPDTATLEEHNPTGSPIALPGNDTVFVHWMTGIDAVGPVGLGTSPSDPFGSAIIVNRAGRYHASFTATYTATVSVAFEIYLTDDQKKTSVHGEFTGSLGVQKAASVAGEHIDLDLGSVIRLGFTSNDTGTVTVYDVVVSMTWTGPELPPP